MARQGMDKHPLQEALMHDAGCGVAVLDADGRITECNALFANLVRAESAEALVGQSFRAGLDESIASRHTRALELATGRGQAAAVDGEFGRLMARATYRPVGGEEFPSVLLVVAPWRPAWPVPPGVAHLGAEPSAEGVLASLTPREREVLAGIGLGMTTAEIAHQLHRSTKTIEGHRVSLGVKLGATNRVQLARVAIRAGLAPLHDRLMEPKGQASASAGVGGLHTDRE